MENNKLQKDILDKLGSIQTEIHEFTRIRDENSRTVGGVKETQKQYKELENEIFYTNAETLYEAFWKAKELQGVLEIEDVSYWVRMAINSLADDLENLIRKSAMKAQTCTKHALLQPMTCKNLSPKKCGLAVDRPPESVV